MQFTADVAQIGLFAMVVDEFRNGVFLGSSQRDFYFVFTDNASACVPTSYGQLEVVSNSLTNGTQNGIYIETCPGSNLSFELQINSIGIAPQDTFTAITSDTFWLVSQLASAAIFEWRVNSTCVGTYFVDMVSDRGRQSRRVIVQ